VEPADLASCTDEQLLEHFIRGHREAFEALVHRYERELFGYLRRYLGDSSLAEDVFQNTFLQLYTRIGMYQAGRPVRPWLYTMATHLGIDALRRAGRHQAVSLDQHREVTQAGDLHNLVTLLESRGPSPLEQVEVEERREIVRDSVDRLPDFLRQVVILAYYQGLKYQDIAKILGIPVGTVKSRLHTALLRLHEAWSAMAALHE
jgi:RNA polymerase sigma-70 factor (ECF subfamily)